MLDLTNEIFHDEDAARLHLEQQRWPAGPVCPHCGSKEVTKLDGAKHRPGLYQCKTKPCREQFTVTVGTVMERSHIPLHKWVMAIQLMAASKKGMSAKQIERMLGVTYRSAWFMMHRIREAMAPAKSGGGQLGGEGKVVEFRWNHRSSLGVEDTERAAAIVKAAEGKRLTYRRIGGPQDAQAQ